MRIPAFSLFIFFAMTASAAAQSASKASTGPAAAFDAVYAQFTTAYKQADPKAVAGLYASNAYYLSPGTKIETGHSFILGEFQRYLGRFKAGAGPNIAFRIVDRQVSGDLAHDIGYIMMNDGKTPLDESAAPGAKFALLWKRDASGTWKIYSDTYNDTPRAADPVRAAAEEGIRKTVQAYFDGVTNHDVAKLDAAFHPEARLSTSNNKGALYNTSYQDWRKFTSEPAGDTTGRNNRIADIKMMGNAAVVTTVLDWPAVRYVDYLSLVKIGDEWKIMSKTWNTERKQN
jgi:ketosteroid isomerase-like protein